MTLREEWTEVEVLFEDLSQEGFGTPVDFDPSTVLAIAVAAKEPGSYDIWLDDVRFFKEQGMSDCESRGIRAAKLLNRIALSAAMTRVANVCSMSVSRRA